MFYLVKRASLFLQKKFSAIGPSPDVQGRRCGSNFSSRRDSGEELKRENFGITVWRSLLRHRGAFLRRRDALCCVTVTPG
jgi:hypothetical protein